jgi:threonylcarbamoyladenosine tRNA methylthiotransferase MtaB
MPHFHIPLQSGSDHILKLMKRRYDTDLFKRRVDVIHKFVTNAFIGVDVITGVRGETDEEFENTRNFLSGLDISQLHVFTYSERPNTQALNIKYSVPHEERKRRSAVLHEISAYKLRKFYQKNEGQEAMVLFEEHATQDVMHGFTENYVKIEYPFTEQLKNKIVKVKLKKISDQTGNMTIEVPKNVVEKHNYRFSPENLQF